MKIAICNRVDSFSEYWIEYCKTEKIDYKIINPYDTDIISSIKDCDVFMWHHHHGNYKDILFAKQLLYSLEAKGIKVFPDFNTTWHFDDKVGQKYLLEAIEAPLVPSYVFYTKKEALAWANKTTFPKVFKLRGGAGSVNVKLVNSKKSCIKIINKAFGKGFTKFDRIQNLKRRIKDFNDGKDTLQGILKGIGRLFISTEIAKMQSNEKGYVYFQNFIPNNETDTRIVVVGNKIIGERRGVRKGDFRASGSNILLPDASLVDIKCVKTAWGIAQKLRLQIGVFDFIHDEVGNPLIVEVSYGTMPDYTECEGYWDEKLNFYPSEINLPKMIIENFLRL